MRGFAPPLLMLCLSAVARADDGWWIGVGGAEGFGKHESIRMEQEDVRISFRDKDVLVQATFWFRNGGPAAEVQMGFPESRSNIEEPAIVDFRTSVDGKRYQATRKSLLVDREERRYDAVWLKSVRFAKGQRRRVDVSFKTFYSGDTSGGSGFEYVLTTGASWAGTIGDCRVSVDWTQSRSRSRPYLLVNRETGPKPRVTVEESTSRREVYRLRNFEPDFDLCWKMAAGFWNFNVNGRRVMPPMPDGNRVTGAGADLLVPLSQLVALMGVEFTVDGLSPDERDFIAPDSKPRPRITQLAFDSPLAKLKLSREGKWMLNLHHYRTACVYLRDVVRGLGGRYKYVPRLDRVEIWIPTRK